MTRFPALLTRATAALVLGSLLVLSGCHSGSTRDGGVSAASMQGQFDTTIQAYKSGQFLIDGAVLSALDAGSHFAYLKEQNQLPKTILLEPSDDSKIRKQHLQYMARMALDYGFTVYYQDGDTLKKINAVANEARDLEEYHAPAKMSDEMERKSAAGSGFDPSMH